VGGNRNYNNAIGGFIGSGNCNATCNSTSGCLSYGAVVVGGVGNNTFGGTWTIASCCFTVAPTLCNAGQYSFIGGGFQNKVQSSNSAIMGGECNSIDSNSFCSVIAGGRVNSICTLQGFGVVSGGVCNVVCGWSHNTIAGGSFNTICNGQTRYSTIGGGSGNRILTTYSYNYQSIVYGSTIAGGTNNTICDSSSGYCANYTATHFIGGGSQNTAGFCTNSSYAVTFPSTVSGGYFNRSINSASFIGGGQCNTASGYFSTISGGKRNQATACYGTVGGGQTNLASGLYSAVLGGAINQATACSSAVLGGVGNYATAASASIVGGERNCAASFATFLGGGCQNFACNNANICGAAFAVVVGGNGNNSTGGTWSASYCIWAVPPTGCNAGQNSFIGGGFQNVATGIASGVMGGCSNTASCACSFIVGSNITSDRVCATFVNNLSIKNIPTSSAGLPSGAVWKNGSVLNIV
jgi:hypothetical protein